MRPILAASLLACTPTLGDEAISTLDQEWMQGQGWKLVGQTISVPESNVLERVSFRASEWSPFDLGYAISIYDWDQDAQHVVGDAYVIELGGLPEGDEVLTHEMDILLKRGSKIAIVIIIENIDVANAGVGYVDSSYEEGSFIGSFGHEKDPWTFGESDAFDMSFEVVFRSCDADVFNDGSLNIFDFLAFQTLFTSGDAKADFNDDGMLNVLDFVAFQSAFQAGC
jgi:hypothetical protein